ncbi:MAG: tryptophan-rich sensory protein [Antricoccus sp.]
MTEEATAADRIRQVAVTISEILCIIGTLVGVGVIGTRVAETSGGALAADATRLAPASTAFSIWSVIYVGLAAYTVYQWLPSQATRQRHRSVGWLIAGSMLLNAAWLLVTQQGWLWVSVVVIVALAVLLGVIALKLTRDTARDWVDRTILDGTLGLYLGWVAVATCANITTALIEAGLNPSAAVADTSAVIVLAVAAALGAVFAWRLGARYTVAIAMAWGLTWIAVGRLADEPVSGPTAIAAIAAAVIVVVAVPWARARSRMLADVVA